MELTNLTELINQLDWNGKKRKGVDSAAAVLLAAAPRRMNELEEDPRDERWGRREAGEKRVELMWDLMRESNGGNGEIGNS